MHNCNLYVGNNIQGHSKKMKGGVMTKNIHNWLLVEKCIRKQTVFYNKFNLSRYEFDVLESLVLFFNPKAKSIYPKQMTLTELTGVHRTNVSTALKKLETIGFIISKKVKNNKKEYYLTKMLFETIGLKTDSTHFQGEIFKSQAFIKNEREVNTARSIAELCAKIKNEYDAERKELDIS